jgi:hypothetical protein
MEPISQIGNECVARDLALQQGARRENILYGSLIDEQRHCSGKDRQPCGAKPWRTPGGVPPQSQNALAMLLRHALPDARQSLAHSLPICEMGSRLEKRRLYDF